MATEPRRPGARPAALLLAPECPYPLAGGGALRTASLLHYLARSYDVDLIVFRPPGAPDPAGQLPPGLVRSSIVIALAPNGRGRGARALRNTVRLLRGVPPLVDRFAGFESQVQQAIEGRRYEVSIIEHFWCAPYWNQISAACNRTVLDLHNLESLLHERCSAVEDGPAAFAHRQFRHASLELERLWLPRFSQVLTASECDAGRARVIAPDAHIMVYPNAIPAVSQPPPADQEVVVFSGNMEYHPNLSAVRFFRNQIWPLLHARWPQLVWRLVGKNPEAIRQFTLGDPQIEVQGQIDDAVQEIARARVAVVPLLAGSGTRLKILEAWAAGVPVVSTSVGAEGLPVRDGEHLLMADEPSDFAAAVSRLLACSNLRQQLARNGRLLLEKEFTWETAWGKLEF